MKLLKKNISIVLILTIILTLFNSQIYASVYVSETNISEEQSLNSIEKISKPNIVLSIKRLNFYNPIAFKVLPSGNDYNVDIFNKLFDYGEVKLSIENNDNRVVIDKVIDKNTLEKVNLGDEVYKCEINVTKKDGSTIVYLGEITPNGSEREYRTLMFDEGNYTEIPVLNGLESVENGIQYLTKYEIEPNNSFDQANTIFDDDDMYGTMYADREDFYKVTFTKAGKANFWLGNIPSGKNHDLYVYEGKTSTPKWSSTSVTGTQELISEVSVKADTVYYIKVTYPSGNMPTGDNYWLRVKLLEYVWPGHTSPQTPSTIEACFYCPQYYKIIGIQHRGIDIISSTGQNVYAIADGTVNFADEYKYDGTDFGPWTWGKNVLITHDYNPAESVTGEKYMRTRSCHLNTISVYEGQKVVKGQKIGTSGNTGYTIGPHLHYETQSANSKTASTWNLFNAKYIFPGLYCNTCYKTINSYDGEYAIEKNTFEGYSGELRLVGIDINGFLIDIENLISKTNGELEKYGISSKDLKIFNEMIQVDDSLSIYYDKIEKISDEI